MQPSKVCFHFAQRGFCSYGNSCRFVHERSGSFVTGSSSYGSGRWAASQNARGGQYRSSEPFGRQQSYTIYHEQQLQVVRATSSRPSCAPRARNERDWSTPSTLEPQGPCLEFRFMSWNVLAAELAHTHAPELYPHARPAWLDWRGRLAAVVEHVAAQRPDVLCLQEVDDWPGIRSALLPLGYDGVHVQRTGGRGDGCATLWLRDRLRLAKPRPKSRRGTAASGSAVEAPSGAGQGEGLQDGGSNQRSSSSGGKKPRHPGVHKIRMADHGLKDNVALLVHLTPVKPRESEDNSGGGSRERGGGEGGRGGGARAVGEVNMEVEEGSDGEGGRLKRSRQAARSSDASAQAYPQQQEEEEEHEDVEVVEGSEGSEDGSRPSGSQQGRRQKRSRCSSDPEDEDDGSMHGGSGGGGKDSAGTGTAAEADSASAAAAAEAIAALRPYSQPGGAATASTKGTSSGRQSCSGAEEPPAAGAAVTTPAAASSARLPLHLRRGFWVANTHVLFNTKRGDIKLGQLRVILTELAQRAAQAEAREEEEARGEEEGGQPRQRSRRRSSAAGSGAAGAAPAAAALPCIFAGDFNTAPGSGLYRFLQRGELQLAGEDRRELSGQVEGYGYSSLQQDARYGRPPRLTRWVPPPPLHQQEEQQAEERSARRSTSAAAGAREEAGGGSAAAYVSDTEQWRRQRQEQLQQRGVRGGDGPQGGAVRHSSYSVRWDMEELENAMGRVALEQAVARASSSSAALSASGPAARGLSGVGSRSFSAGDRSSDGGGGGAVVRTLTEAEPLPLGGRQHPTSWQGNGGGGGRGQGRGGGGRGNGSNAASWGSIKDAAVVRHPLTLRSAYAAADPAGREPLFTTLHARYVGTVDFVWYTPGAAEPGEAPGAEGPEGCRRERGGSAPRMQGVAAGFRLAPLRVLHPPDPLAYPYGMPCDGWPSDHVSLVVDFRLS
ncbi:hypothetical protein Agub_g4069 [Astrephomene gubernaculifera]|uniref:C3H1-type domain-containing protein n=1 Tax=Astrephomene gubernaculifera TaxID=47775 RepID=A0AAD3DMA8_9CHLO|nr:hypothetical protein Agub_g4069 [Astrephomene gubernaculifera]